MKPSLALFDLDHTLLPLDSDYAWGQFLVKVGAVNATSFAADNQRLMDSYNAGTLTAAESLPILLAPLSAHPRAQLDAWHAQFMAEVIAPALLPAAHALLARHVNFGHTVLIVTATNRFVTAPIATALGVPDTHLIATEPETMTGQWDSDFTGRWVGTPSFKAGKISRVNDWLAARGQTLASFEESWFYSDSSNDLPLLEVVSHPVVCNPSAGLEVTAIARGWRIIRLWGAS
jgi:HAD superfamily hydrolase (TIGR01490 family)